MNVMKISALIIGGGVLAACQPTPAAETVSANEDLNAVQLQQLDENNDGMVSSSESQRIEDVAERGPNAIPDSQLVDLDD